MNNPLDRIFKPQTIAVIGASNDKESVGHALIKNLIGAGYDGVVYPVNIKHRSIQGIRSYSSLKDIPDPVDLAIIATPTHTVPAIVAQCGEAGVGGLVIITAGFKEMGPEGVRMSEEILQTVRKYGMRMVGPNCLGFINPAMNLNATFGNTTALPGNIAFISQSGALCTAILDWANEQNVGFSNFVSIGSMVDVGFSDLIDYFGSDPHTSAILIYMESLTDARKFLSAARAFSRTKPIIVLKAGKSEQGAKAASSHTGTLAGNDVAFEAAFKRAGIVRVQSIAALFNMAQALAMQKRPKGNRLAVITNAGGPGVLATDYLIGHGGQLASLSPDTLDALNKVLPPTWSHGNPVDVIGDATPERYQRATEICLKDPAVDGILVILTPQAMTDPAKVAEAIIQASQKYGKTVLASWMGESDVNAGREILEKGNIPSYRFPESAVDIFLSMHSYSRNIELLYEMPSNIPHAFQPEREKTRALLDKVRSEGRYSLTEIEGKQLMDFYGIPVTRYGLAKSREEASKIAAEIGFPVVMKVSSPDILHKTDVGGVILNIESELAAGEAFDLIMENARTHKPGAAIEGVLVEEMAKKKYELLIGAKKDPIFGPIIVFGMGGVAVEIFKDLNAGLPPLNMALAKRIIEDTRIYSLLKGYRGMPAVDIDSIQFLLYKFAYMVMDFPDIHEIDINPFMVDEHGGIVLDAVVVLEKEPVKNKKPFEHLSISPYPAEYESSFLLKNGMEVSLRPIRPEDEPMEAEMFTLLSKETQYFRFFGYIPNVTHNLLARFTQIDYDREIAIIAEVEEEGRKKMAGVVRLVADAYNESAEFAIVVADPWQGQGLGNKFTDYIMEIAKERGIRKVYASVLKANHIMVHMFRSRGFEIRPQDFESLSAEKVLEKEPIAG